jgi:hypothetical protein
MFGRAKPKKLTFVYTNPLMLTVGADVYEKPQVLYNGAPSPGTSRPNHGLVFVLDAGSVLPAGLMLLGDGVVFGTRELCYCAQSTALHGQQATTNA